ncbi:hypothetical protein HPB51_024504 [Rhipicephalus microplus]|uniref:Tick transposon n=1 Tax=Rhipicephalus microplus TaxID=6941 RepID=A0A9J6DY17_RHIMP|nr:hypothetical protein HPB51_024504 [Rhipicephalus microplus]
MYGKYKAELGREKLYDNSVGCTLIFEARAGALRTLTYRSRFDQDPQVQAAICRCCSETNETAEHLILDCARLSPRPAEGTTLPQALGFAAEDHDANDATAVVTTKARLQMLWKATV